MKVSVIIPTVNRSEMVCRCVKSVLDSDYPDIEVIVVDDCSPDDADYAWRILRQTKGQAWILSSAVTTHQNFLRGTIAGILGL